MNQSAFRASAGASVENYDFNENYRYLKRLLQDLRQENGPSVRQELFGEEQRERPLTKKEMKQMFRFLRKIENHYEECCTPPIPEELEHSIRAKASSNWLPWESEAIEKVDAWRAALQDRRRKARDLFQTALEKIRRGEKLP
ncbi:MAG: hypothetical protein AB1733_02960 [Thermodesulfobacteriota bacterium]|jgi:hypothetical protein